MKFTYFLSLTILLACLSCNTDDVSSDDTNTTDYFPLKADSYWTYDNENEQVGASKDSLYVSGTEMQNGMTYTNLDAKLPATGFMTQLLSNNIVRTTETQLYINGTLGLPIEGLSNLSLPLNDLRLYDTDVDISADSVLGESTGSIIQNINTIPIEINYGITSTMLGISNNSTIEAPQISSELRVNMSIVAMVQVGQITLPVPIIQEQDVLVATNSYTDGVGLTNSQVLISITLEDLSEFGLELPFPESNSINSTQTIDAYFIGE